MKVLIACEESQEVCKAFRTLGHEAYSCDIQEPSGGHPEWHILGDAVKLAQMPISVFKTMDGKEHCVEWDLLIAHPPCTYLSNAGARHLWKDHQLQADRVMLGIKARDFFMEFYRSPIPLRAVENPIPSRVFCMPEYSQAIQPYQFGHPYTKKLAYGCAIFRILPQQILCLRLQHGVRVAVTAISMRNSTKVCLPRIGPKTAQRPSPASPELWRSNGAEI